MASLNTASTYRPQLCNKFALDGGHVSHTLNGKNLLVDTNPKGNVMEEKYHVTTESIYY